MMLFRLFPLLAACLLLSSCARVVQDFDYKPNELDEGGSRAITSDKGLHGQRLGARSTRQEQGTPTRSYAVAGVVLRG